MQKSQNIYNLACNFYQRRLTPEIINYLEKERGLFKKAISEFKIGYSPPPDSGLFTFLEEMGFSAEEIIESRLYNEKNEEFFSGCIIFPNLTPDEEILNISGIHYPSGKRKMLP